MEGNVMIKSGQLIPATFGELMQFSEMLSKSDLVPRQYKGKPAEVLVAIQWGIEIGLNPIQSLQNISVVAGKPCLWGDATVALVRRSGLLENMRETFDEANEKAICTVKRVGQTEEERTFSKEDAIRAKLWGKEGPWQNYPRRMLQQRAKGFALRDVFADVLQGLWTVEEARDIRAQERAINPMQYADREDAGRATMEPPVSLLAEEAPRGEPTSKPTSKATSKSDTNPGMSPIAAIHRNRINRSSTREELDTVMRNLQTVIQLSKFSDDEVQDLRDAAREKIAQIAGGSDVQAD